MLYSQNVEESLRYVEDKICEKCRLLADWMDAGIPALVDGIIRIPDDQAAPRACDVNCSPNGSQSCRFIVRFHFSSW